MKTIKVMTPRITPVGMMDDWHYVYKIDRIKGIYKLGGHDHSSDRFIFKKLSNSEVKKLVKEKRINIK